jgi:hypothetical protein
LLADRNLYIMGNSLQLDMATMMKCQVNSHSRERVHFFRQDHLALNPFIKKGGKTQENVTAEDAGKAILNAWKRVKKPDARSILVINAGVHWRYGSADFYSFMQLFVRGLRTVYSGLVVFRTNVMGHACCFRFDGPVSANETEQFAANALYNWHDFSVTPISITASSSNQERTEISGIEARQGKARQKGNCVEGVYDVGNSCVSRGERHQLPCVGRQHV